MATSSDSSMTVCLEPQMTITDLSLEGLPSQANTVSTMSQKSTQSFQASASSEAATESFIDSGYNSWSSTPDGNRSASSKAGWSQGGSNPFQLFRKKKISFFDKEVDKPTRERFKTIQTYLEGLVLGQLRAHLKPGTKYSPMSIRLAMMGISEDEARPHIVILCQPTHKSLIRGFVKQIIVTDICRPRQTGVPCFEVVVLGNAPRLHLGISDIEVIADTECILGRSQNTLCGVPISFRHPSGQRRNATLGGVIKVVTASGGIELFGMTAGHALHQWKHGEPLQQDDAVSIESNQPNAPHPGTPAWSSDDDGDDDDDTDIEIDFSNLGFEKFPETTNHIVSRQWNFDKTTVLGRTIKNGSTKKCYDWALFQPMDFRKGFAMNHIPTDGVEGKAELKVSQHRPGEINNRPVFVLSGSTNCKRGNILSEPGRFLGDGEEFIDTFMITINDSLGIQDGDSGSWVVDARNFKVYGQLVASDVLGDGYVVPMVDIMDDIKSQLGAQIVGLPDLVDIYGTLEMAEGSISSQGLSESPPTRPRDHLVGLNRRSNYFTLDPRPYDSGYSSGDQSSKAYRYQFHDSGYTSLSSSPAETPSTFRGTTRIEPQVPQEFQGPRPSRLRRLFSEWREKWRQNRMKG
ncbi:hypothetical protein F4677DRAFT_241151 [Hypoxylon crocopeplum]|nr:hypothetical protein F4677DRAFT_241151 [Hypoxylon crocopeplum]